VHARRHSDISCAKTANFAVAGNSVLLLLQVKIDNQQATLEAIEMSAATLASQWHIKVAMYQTMPLAVCYLLAD